MAYNRPDPRSQYTIALNTSTIKGQNLSLIDEVGITAQAGYNAIEPWVRELDKYTAEGGSLDDLGKQITDKGLSVANLIGFFEWIVNDEQRREKGIEEARRCFAMAQKVGCTMVAAPPMGAHMDKSVHLDDAAQRYAAIIDIGKEYGVVPVLEFWGIAQTLGTFGEALHIAAQCGRPQACILADVFHMYKGGSPFDALQLIGADTIAILHVNDYAALPPKETIADKDRIYPGDGIAPYKFIISRLKEAGFHGVLSVELFNETYWKEDALTVAKTGLQKIKSLVGAFAK